ncbi:ATP-binding protein [Streptomyces sp. Z26]|uniref:ATP-binding protein n=1 Tax=Streptomyces sp. Z26 TaxID=2500177 RepID=UPI0019D1BD64|nr:ATP-binding protein [Streptomyces sp. Z26]
MTDIPVALTVLTSVGTIAAVAMAPVLARTRGRLRAYGQRAATAETDLGNVTQHRDELEARLRTTEAELRHLAGARLPDLATSLSHPHMPVRGPADERVTGTELDRALTEVLDQVADAVGKERLRIDAAAQSALRGTATTIQALLYQLQSLLQEMQERYDEPALAQDLLAADFLNEQALRRIQTSAVLCGAWPGLTRQDSHLTDIVLGAMSRLQGYERVQVTNQLRGPAGVVARAVEPVAVALTELIANALHHSRPDLPVTVTVQQGSTGASVIVDDAGVGMHEDEVQRAQRLMSGQEPVLLTELGDPVRSGFAAIGQLVRQYGFSVHVETSPYGGVRAVLHVPGEPLLTMLDEDAYPRSPMAPLPTPQPVPPAEPATPAGPAAQEATGRETAAQEAPGQEELPRRRRRRPARQTPAPAPQAPHPYPHPRPVNDDTVTLRAADIAAEAERWSRGAASAPPPPEIEAEAERSAARWGDFQRGTTSGRAASTGDTGEYPLPPHPGPGPATDGPSAANGPTAAPTTPDPDPASEGNPTV